MEMNAEPLWYRFLERVHPTSADREFASVEFELTLTSTPRCSKRRNPDASTITLYVPAGIRGKTYPPSALVVVSRERPVAGLIAVTFAPTIAAPLWSATVPAIVPVGSAARASMVARSNNAERPAL